MVQYHGTKEFVEEHTKPTTNKRKKSRPIPMQDGCGRIIDFGNTV